MPSRRLVLLLSLFALTLGGCGSSDGEASGGATPASEPSAAAEVATTPPSTTGAPSAADAASLADNPANSPGAKKAIAYGLKISGSRDTECGDQATAGSVPTDAAKDPGCTFVAASFACLAVLEPSADFAPDLIRTQFEKAGSKILAAFDQGLKDCEGLK